MRAPATPRTRRCSRCRRPVIRFTDDIGMSVTVEATPVSVLDPLQDTACRLWEWLGPRVGWRLYWPPRTWRPVHRVHTCADH